MLKKIVLICGIVVLKFDTYAQNQDSIPQKVMAVVADKFPATRVMNLEYQSTGSYKFSSKYLGNDLPKGEVTALHQVSGSININLVKKSKWTLGANVGYRFISIASQNSDLFPEQIKHEADYFHYHHESLNFTYYSKLFGKMIIYSGRVMVDGSEKGIERAKGIVTGTLVLKATKKVQMSIGLVALLDPAAIVPVLPTFIYKEQYANGWMLDMVLPRSAYVRKTIFPNSRLSLGADITSTFFYLHNFAGSDHVYSFNQMEINSGLIYEHNLGGSFIVSFKTGMKTIPRARIFEKNEKQEDYIFEASPNPSLYFNAGLSFNPFAKKRR
ncbi:DUF6268 family outer membrane beta-barrel protein [Sphingobacterium sp. SRCM116780]|uniref:DUF6268 family outer membrane beta-barrel protein n=1 Tax=Sphingobacterium sp. SRCM116780 TaxID=2907623 RepID=UPI001F2561CE|nr:DUF6268 family outer membrane beta-barrel protein [Sphingobacterium sp. SRCM116780]UIR54866.1 DUF6268 family outer membrane beta-barrel protein [Sphingobacterium sp. SRCM116780]